MIIEYKFDRFVTHGLQIDNQTLHSNHKAMETSLIEKLDKSRYNLIKWFTLGWSIWFGGFILKGLISNKLLINIIAFIGLIGAIIYAINLLRFLKIVKIVNANNELKSALNDELTMQNRLKSFKVGFCTLSVLISIFYVLSIFTSIPALVVCEVTLFFGVLSVLISSLIYNRV